MLNLSWGPAEWSAFAELLLACSAAMAGVWALYNFNLSRRTDRAQWLKQIFVEFYLDDSFSKVRSYLEYKYETHLRTLIEKRFYDRELPLDEESTSVLKELDQLLNYFEHLLYLEENGLLLKQDRLAVFEYWFDILSDKKMAIVRRYTAHFGFERVAKELNANETNMIALYGSLRQDQPAFDELGLGEHLRWISDCKFNGKMYDLGEYPGVVEDSDSIIHGQLFEVLNPSAIEILDKFERFFANDIDNSLYIRTCIQLREPNTEAWTYYYNTSKDERDYKSKPVVADGNWSKHHKK